MSGEIRTIKFFLASSIREFEQERAKLRDNLLSLNEIYEKYPLRIAVVDSEHLSHAMDADGSQSAINREILDCDFFCLLVGRDLGPYTLEEFRTAREWLFKDGSLKILTFFRRFEDEREMTNAAWNFQDKVRNEYKHYISEFEVLPEVIVDIRDELARYVSELTVSGHVELASRKEVPPEKISGYIEANRKRLAELLSMEEVTLENQPEILRLYEENRAFAKSPHAAPEDRNELYNYACFLRDQGDYKSAAEVGMEMENLTSRSDRDDRTDGDNGMDGDNGTDGDNCAALDGDDYAALELLLGDCFRELQKPEQAERRYRAARDIWREDAECGEDCAEVCRKLAGVLFPTGRPREAERLWREALDFYLHMPEEDQPEDYWEILSKVCGDLSIALRHLSRGLHYPGYEPGEAEILRSASNAYENALERMDSMEDEEESDEVLAAQDAELRAAEGAVRTWLDGLRKKGRPEIQIDLPDLPEADAEPEKWKQVQSILLGIAKALYSHRWMEEAERILRDAMAVWRPLAEADPAGYDVSPVLNRLGILLAKTHRADEAEALCREALAIRRRYVKDQDRYEPTVAISCGNLGNLLHETGRYQEAEPLVREALEIWRQCAKENPARHEPDVAKSCYNLGNLLSDTGRNEEAEPLHREALEIRRRYAAGDPARYEPDVAMSCNNYGNLLADTGRYQEAESLDREALEIRRRYAAENPAQFEPDVAGTAWNLATLLLHHIGGRDEARRLLWEAAELFAVHNRSDMANRARNVLRHYFDPYLP